MDPQEPVGGARPAAQQAALAQILQIMAANGLSADDIRQAMAPRDSETTAASLAAGKRGSLGQLILRVFYYLGGTLVFAGLGIYTNTVWHDLQSFSRVLITLGAGFVAFLLGMVFARDEHLEQASTPAHILAFLLQPVGIAVLLREYFHGSDTALGAMIVFGPLAVQQFLAFLALKRPSLLLFSLLYFYGFLGAATVHFSFDRGIASLACGLFLFFIAVDLERRPAYRDLAPLFFLLGPSLILAGLYYHVGRTIFDPVMLAVTLGFLAHAVLSSSRSLYAVAVFYLVLYFSGGPGGGWFGWPVHHRFFLELTAVFTGTSLVLAGHWITRSPFISAAPLWLFTGGCYALGGVYSMLSSTPGEPLFAGAATLAMYAALLLRSRALLAASILGLLSFITYYANKHFAGSLGWPLLLVLLGFVLLLGGFVFARLSARMREA